MEGSGAALPVPKLLWLFSRLFPWRLHTSCAQEIPCWVIHLLVLMFVGRQVPQSIRVSLKGKMLAFRASLAFLNDIKM